MFKEKKAKVLVEPLFTKGFGIAYSGFSFKVKYKYFWYLERHTLREYDGKKSTVNIKKARKKIGKGLSKKKHSLSKKKTVFFF